MFETKFKNEVVRLVKIGFKSAIEHCKSSVILSDWRFYEGFPTIRRLAIDLAFEKLCKANVYTTSIKTNCRNNSRHLEIQYKDIVLTQHHVNGYNKVRKAIYRQELSSFNPDLPFEKKQLEPGINDKIINKIKSFMIVYNGFLNPDYVKIIAITKQNKIIYNRELLMLEETKQEQEVIEKQINIIIKALENEKNKNI